MAELTVIRLGRLGDLVMLEPALRWLAATDGVAVTLVSEPRYASFIRALAPGVEVADELPRSDLVLDLHRVAASRRLRRGRPWVGVRKEDLRRRSRVLAPWLPLRPQRTWPERHLEAARLAMRRLGLDPGSPPSATPKIEPSAPVEPGLLGISPGAGHANKRWPLDRWRELARLWPGRVMTFGAPDEAPLLDELGLPRWPDCSLTGLVAGLSRCEVVAAGDTGPLHVAGALGRRVVGLFGPTPIDTGFWVWGGHGRVLREPPSCSPCTLHGGPRCPKVHHACMMDISPAQVLEAACA